MNFNITCFEGYSMNKFIISLLPAILLTACSSKDLYQVGQDYQKSECINKAQTAEQHSECTNTKGKTYEEYEKERKAVVN